MDILSLLKADFSCSHLINGSATLLNSADANKIAKVIVNFWKVNKITPSRSEFLYAFEKIKQFFKAQDIKDWIGGESKGRGLLHERVYNTNKLIKKHIGKENSEQTHQRSLYEKQIFVRS